MKEKHLPVFWCFVSSVVVFYSTLCGDGGWRVVAVAFHMTMSNNTLRNNKHRRRKKQLALSQDIQQFITSGSGFCFDSLPQSQNLFLKCICHLWSHQNRGNTFYTPVVANTKVWRPSVWLMRSLFLPLDVACAKRPGGPELSSCGCTLSDFPERRGGGSFMTQDNLKPQFGTCPSSPPPLIPAACVSLARRNPLVSFCSP